MQQIRKPLRLMRIQEAATEEAATEEASSQAE